MEYISDSITDIYYTPIKSIDDDKIDQLLELFHLDHDENL